MTLKELNRKWNKLDVETRCPYEFTEDLDGFVHVDQNSQSMAYRDEDWVVFANGEKFYKLVGVYQNEYDGTFWDDNWIEVKKVQRQIVITDWETV